MSAFLCSPYHIGRIAAFAEKEAGAYARYWIPTLNGYQAPSGTDPERAALIAAYLASLNAESVMVRYDLDDLDDAPGLLPGWTEVVDYQAACAAAARQRASRHDVFDILDAVRCLRYQSCETTGWVESDGFRALAWITDVAVAKLLESEEAHGWELRPGPDAAGLSLAGLA